RTRSKRPMRRQLSKTPSAVLFCALCRISQKGIICGLVFRAKRPAREDAAKKLMKQKTKTREFCPACGAVVTTTREAACGVCGKLLQEGYFPLDNLKASYRNRG